MGILTRMKGELIDIIQWNESDNETLAYRYERYGNEIKNGAQLIVREGQLAVFVNKGALADVFSPGQYKLSSDNLPILSTLKGWKYGFESPFKAEVYFISTRIMSDFGWGTPGPFRLRDPEFGILEMTSRGHFSFHVEDAALFIRNVVGSEGEFTKEEIKGRLRKKFVTEAISAIAETGKSFYDMAQHYDELSLDIKSRINPIFLSEYGISLNDTSIQSIDLTEKSAEKVESRDSDIWADQRLMRGTYQQQAQSDALKLMAQNPGPGGLAAGGMGMGMGMAMANQMGGAHGNAGMGMMSPMGGAMMGAAMGGAVAPPPPSGMMYHLFVNGQQVGPIDSNQFPSLIEQGQLTATTQVWCQGMAGWSAAGQVAALQALFGQATPPPPPGSVPPPMTSEEE